MVYYLNSIGGDRMDNNNRIYKDMRKALIDEGMSYDKACDTFGNNYTRQLLSRKLTRGSMKYNEAVELFDKLGYDVVVVKRKA